MHIQHEETEGEGQFFVTVDEKKLAELDYWYSEPGKMLIDHTEVSTVLEGKGIGRQLVRAAVEFARNKGLKVIPACPFAREVIHKTPEFQDVLA